MRIRLETSQELGAEVGVVLREVTVVAEVVAGAVDGDKVAKTTETKRNCLAGVIRQMNGDSSRMSRRKLLESLDRPTNDKRAQCLPLQHRIIMRQATSQVLHMLATNSQKLTRKRRAE